MENLKDNNGGTIFLIGLSGAGKTTLAKLLVEKMQDLLYPCLLLDGCEMRAFNILGDCLGHDLESRKERMMNLTPIVEMVSAQGIVPIVAIIGQPPEARDYWRDNLSNYTEVYLHCGLKECVKRDNKHLYQDAFDHKMKDVIGVDLPFVEPKKSEIVLETSKFSPEELIEQLWSKLEELYWFKRFIALREAMMEGRMIV
ncbi:MAG: adenylyl-sulfate kinase [Candidatus Omnitrophica bacterium]|nr:adenylyl-sulfate kinase [Candidatus Omnitrophota bacterium]MBU4333892.1 adenylyl-sulfate kinase [Candidatus Omnitrophota bacterium]